MKTLKKFIEGDSIPDGAKYLQTVKELDPEKSYIELERIPIFGGKREVRIIPRSTFHYYEVEAK